jgi:hypothetical protein
MLPCIDPGSEAFGPSDIELDILLNRPLDMQHPGRKSDK